MSKNGADYLTVTINIVTKRLWLEPFCNHQVVGIKNQSTASSTAYPIPIEKVKNGYDYIIRGLNIWSKDLKTLTL